MMPGTTLKGYTFVGCPARLGHVVKTGPITGKTWEISPQGTWIDEDDAACLVEEVEMVYCAKVLGEIPTHTVFGIDANDRQIDQLERMLNDGC